jgi:DNA-binding NtrC family response regulator
MELLEVWRLFDSVTYSLDPSPLLEATLDVLLGQLDADRAATFRKTDEEWTCTAAASRSGDREPLSPSPVLLDLSVSEAKVRYDVVARQVAVTITVGTNARDLVIVERRERAFDPAEPAVAALENAAPLFSRVLTNLDALKEAHRLRHSVDERLRKQAIELRRVMRSGQGLISTDARMQEVLRTIEQCARSNVSVLITGETGTGKEAAAQLIHRLSGRTGPLVAVDAGSIPEQLLESELFGHERGAFTGAEGRRIGRFEEAQKGTLLLDEIGELPLHLQPKLLRVLQERKIRRIGGDREIELDVRVIAATNRDLGAMAARGEFREDLLFRLRVVEIELPSLRDRGEDSVVLTLYFLRNFCAELGRDLLSISPETEAAIRAFAWPGNVRELQNRVRRAVITCLGTEITPEDLQIPRATEDRPAERAPRRRPSPLPASAPPAEDAPASPAGSPGTLEEALADWFWQCWTVSKESAPQDQVEAFLLRAALEASSGSLRGAAGMLDMHVDTFTGHLEKLSHPSLSRTIRGHAAAKALVDALHAPKREGAMPVMERVLAAILRELFIYCHGNKSEMARHLAWGRRTLAQHLRRLVADTSLAS